MTDTWLIVGLGNPGPEYSGNRHNVGQMVLDGLAARIGGKFKAHKARALVVEGRLGIGGPRVVLATPGTYMNVSGGPVSALARFYDVEPSRVVAVHDEIDIPFNTVKLNIGGGEGGHTRLRDISKGLATKD
jgi:PTH1 family peptidyl-tRNA hydrolase